MTNGNQSVSPLTVDIINLRQLGHLNNAGEDNGLGLTKREYFAAMAMQGFISSRKDSVSDFDTEMNKKYAESSVKIADSLINALNK